MKGQITLYMINKEEFQSFPAHRLRGESSLVPYGYRRVQLFCRSALLPLSQKLRELQHLIFLPIFLRHVQVIIYHQILQEKSCRFTKTSFHFARRLWSISYSNPIECCFVNFFALQRNAKNNALILPTERKKRGWRGLNDRSNACFGGIFLY